MRVGKLVGSGDVQGIRSGILYRDSMGKRTEQKSVVVVELHLEEGPKIWDRSREASAYQWE